MIRFDIGSSMMIQNAVQVRHVEIAAEVDAEVAIEAVAREIGEAASERPATS